TLPRVHASTSSSTAGLNVSYPYLAVCLLGASAAKARSPWLFVTGLLLLLGWALWDCRAQGFRPVAWGASLAAAIALGMAGQHGLFYLQTILQKLDSALVMRFGQASLLDAKETRTMLGAIGHLKLSGHIVLRVNSGDKAPPALLREASYNLF